MSTEAKKKQFVNNEIDKKDTDIYKKIAQRYAIALPKHLNFDGTDQAVEMQYTPDVRELKILPEERLDPIGDFEHTVTKGLVHRYPDRVLFKIVDTCAVYCRYCFRREMVGPQHRKNNTVRPELITDDDRQKALDYIIKNKNIREVILSGGDPLVLSPKKLSHYLNKIEKIQHIDTIRIHTRVPIAAPEKMTDALVNSLDRKKPLYLILHINHADELTDDVKKLLYSLSRKGCVLLSQSVLLKGINNCAQTLENLFRSLISLRVRPYFLHHPDRAPGTSHFRVSLKEGMKIYKLLQKNITSIALPQYMLDLPGGHGKINIMSANVKKSKDQKYIIIDRKGKSHIYIDFEENTDWSEKGGV